MASTRQRIDRLLVAKGFVESRQRAQALLMAGRILVDGQKVEKPGTLVHTGSAIRMLGDMPYVSRAGGKLEAALHHFRIAVTNRICADLGASTGGFSDCLLQHGAAVVHAYDVEGSQLDWKLRNHPGIVLHAPCNVRYLKARDLPEGISLVSVDLSFISLTKILTPLRDAMLPHLAVRTGRTAESQADLVLLVKPQFEVGKGAVGKGGIVRDPDKQRMALDGVIANAAAAGYTVKESLPSPILGAKGNQEYLLHLQLAFGL
jgi:23S rRNA (cytidine1920-2'-O)/16S rRNA (cytidine1409-2'-O)-methyltransferase